MTKKHSLKLPASIHSPEQAYFCIQQLRHHRTLFLQNAENSNADTGHLYKITSEFVGDTKPTTDIVEEIIELLEQVRVKAPRFHMTFADIPDEELKENTVKWFRDNIHENALVTFKYNRSIAGGCTVRTRNRIYDFSFRKKLLNPKRDIIQLIEHG